MVLFFQSAQSLGMSNTGSKNWIAHVFPRRVFSAPKLHPGPDAGHTAVNVADIALAFMDQIGQLVKSMTGHILFALQRVFNEFESFANNGISGNQN